ncbi:MAG: hypothetical protein MUO40_05915 [Anaerolineaceae bacterium]|nr:hypothetical protein [Anaerolineaceae bacterium]
MKKGRLFLILSVFLLSLVFAVPTAAQGPAGDWVSSFYCVNQDTVNPATISLAFYQENNGTAALTYSDSIAAGKSKNYYTPTTPSGVPDPFLGSVVVSSSTPLACSVVNNTTAVGTSGDPFRYSSSGGFSSGEAAAVLYATQVVRDFWGYESYIAIQNTSTSPTDVTVTFKDRYGTDFPAATQNLTVPGQSNRVLYLTSIAALGSGFTGSAKISADDATTPLAVMEAYYNSAVDANTSQIQAFNAATVGDDYVYAPQVVRSYYGYNGGIQIVNVGLANTSFKITFTMGTGINQVIAVYQHGVELAPGEVKDLYLPNLTELVDVDGKPMAERTGFAVIEAASTGGVHNSAGELAANVNITNVGAYPTLEAWGGRGATYNAFPESAASTKLYIPNMPVHVGGIWSGGFFIANFGGSAGTCDITFVDDVDAFMNDEPIAVNGYINKWAPNVTNLDSGYNSGMWVDCTVPVFGIGNLNADGTSTYGDSYIQFNAIAP